MSSLRLSVALACALLLSAGRASADPIPVTVCHQRIVNGSGQLTVDLDCSADPRAIGVDVTNGKLYLNGHSISGAQIGVACSERCAIYGPGTITGNITGVDQFSSQPDAGAVTVKDAVITGND